MSVKGLVRCERVSAGANESLKIVTEIDIQKLREDFSRSGYGSKWFMHLQHLDSTIELLNTQQKKAYSILGSEVISLPEKLTSSKQDTS